jgi:monofunctional biosynthetic peptidoglycan transglycosylase
MLLGVLAGVVALLLIVALVRVGPIDVRGLAHRDPGRSALMLQREREARQRGDAYHESRTWVRFDRISPYVRSAVLVAEDDKFFSHDGFDWAGIRDAARKNLRTHKVVRGGSTITQQLAKNLWLGSSRTPWRKFEEMILAVRLERALTKRRILELYLNTIEWGDGVFGIDAAARHWFGVSAGALDANQSVRLAAVIINPRRFSPVAPDRRIERRIQIIAGRMRRRGAMSEGEYRITLGLPAEAPAPAVDSTLFEPADLPAAAPAPPDSAASGTETTEPAPADSVLPSDPQ